ncbi:MAG: hypothetical protein ACKOZU_06580 [Planctomycetaceae bacterium]
MTRSPQTSAVAAIMLVAACVAAPAEPPRDAETVVRTAVAAGERQWRVVAEADPSPDFGTRWPLWYALALCEAGAHADRIPRLLELATAMQVRDPAAPGHGNFRWYWRDPVATDPNAVEFCGLDLHLLHRLHRDRLAEPERRALDDLARLAVEGCLRHRVRPSYTNIAILNAANLIALGESLALPAAADEGYRRLERLAVETWRHGLHEYGSPVYYGIDLDGLLAIERFAERERGRELARVMLEFLWTDVAATWFPAAGRLSGPYSRSYDYLHGSGGLLDHLRWEGWLDGVPGGASGIHAVAGRWRPPAALLDSARTRFPRLVRRSWGPLAEESSTLWLLADVTLGCAGAAYGRDDTPLAFDLAAPPGTVRGYFIPDGREDPYGRIRYPTGHAGHPKPLHLQPFWAGAQRTGDALGLAVYRDGDLAGAEVRNLQSHVVLPSALDGLWLRGRRLAIGDVTGTPDDHVRIPVEPGDPLVLRRGPAAAGIRVAWARAQDGGPCAIALVGDGNRCGALRLTVEHRRDARTAPAGAAVWVRVGGGLDDAAFAAWREAFERAPPAVVDASTERVSVAVAGGDGPVAVAATAPFAGESPVRLEPAPSRAVLEIDGVDVGRPIFERIEPFRGAARALAPDRAVVVPAAGTCGWEAESGLVLPDMAVIDDDGASGRRAVLAAAPPAGNATWRLDVARAGRHWLWARVRAADSESDSFRVVVTDGAGRNVVRGAWHLPRATDWTWAPLRLDHAPAPTPLDLPVGTVELSLEPRETGSVVDALWMTANPDARPADQVTAAPGGLTPPGIAPR